MGVAIASISGVKKMQGEAQDGFAIVLVEFVFEKPLFEATQDIRDAISGIRNDLPVEMEEPIIKKLNDTDRPIVSLALASDSLSAAELTRHRDVLAAVQSGVDAANERLSRVEQVKRFTVLPTDWLPGGDELTPTMKLKRKPICQKYAEEIDKLYEKN